MKISKTPVQQGVLGQMVLKVCLDVHMAAAGPQDCVIG